MKNKIYNVKYLGSDGVTGEHKIYAMSEKEARTILHSMFPNARIYYCEQLGAIEITPSNNGIVQMVDRATGTREGATKMESSTMELEYICKRIDDLEQAVSIFENLGGVVDIGKVNFVQFYDDENNNAGKAKKLCRQLVKIVNEEVSGGFVYLMFESRF